MPITPSICGKELSNNAGVTYTNWLQLTGLNPEFLWVRIPPSVQQWLGSPNGRGGWLKPNSCEGSNPSQVTSKIVLWCNGSTAGFEPVCQGSNPCRTTEVKTVT